MFLVFRCPITYQRIIKIGEGHLRYLPCQLRRKLEDKNIELEVSPRLKRGLELPRNQVDISVT